MLAASRTAGAIWITVSRQTLSHREARQCADGERNLRTLALVLAARMDGAKAHLAGTRVARVITPNLSGFAEAGVVDDAVACSGGFATVFSFVRRNRGHRQRPHHRVGRRPALGPDGARPSPKRRRPWTPWRPT